MRGAAVNKSKRIAISLVSGVLREFMLDSRNRGVTVFADSNPDL